MSHPLQHVSLDTFEQRARAGKVTTKVEADLRVVVALIVAARRARRLLSAQLQHAGAVEVSKAFTDLAAALASVPE